MWGCSPSCQLRPSCSCTHYSLWMLPLPSGSSILKAFRMVSSVSVPAAKGHRVPYCPRALSPCPGASLPGSLPAPEPQEAWGNHSQGPQGQSMPAAGARDLGVRDRGRWTAGHTGGLELTWLWVADGISGHGEIQTSVCNVWTSKH